MRDALASISGRRLAWWGLTLGVTAAHLWVAQQISQEAWLGEGSGAAPKRMEVAFVRELAPQAPLAPPPRASRVPGVQDRAATAALPASAPASSPDPAPEAHSAMSVPTAPNEPVAATPQTAEPAPPSTLASVAAAASSASASAASGPTSAAAFEWPPSTRLTYSLTGYYRGPVEGGAQVQWLRRDQRYQVHLDVFIGPSFAPLVTRRMSSDGEITDQGLRPVRYDEETQVSVLSPRRQSIFFEPERVRLPGGQSVTPLPGIQDTASQFVQLTWLFTTQPERLRVGQTVEVPLALPRRIDRWIYDIAAQETVNTPAGAISTFYVKPRRENQSANDLAVEAWFAPSLQYLPVRIRIRQDEQTWLDLLMQKMPQQATR